MSNKATIIDVIKNRIEDLFDFIELYDLKITMPFKNEEEIKYHGNKELADILLKLKGKLKNIKFDNKQIIYDKIAEILLIINNIDVINKCLQN